MTVHGELRQELGRMLELIESRAAGPELLEQVKRIDQLREQLGPHLPPMLRHYLEKRSYPKALEFFAGRDEAAKPNCP